MATACAAVAIAISVASSPGARERVSLSAARHPEEDGSVITIPALDDLSRDAFVTLLG